MSDKESQKLDCIESGECHNTADLVKGDILLPKQVNKRYIKQRSDLTGVSGLTGLEKEEEGK